MALLRAILKEPEILILDEPTTKDPIIAKQINLLIKEVVKKKKITITVTHDMDSVYEYSDYTAFIKEGRIKWYGQSKSIKSSKNNDLKISLWEFLDGDYFWKII